MTSVWAPSKWGRFFSRSPDWTLTREGVRLIFIVDGAEYIVDLTKSPSLAVRNGLFWASVTIKPEVLSPIKVGGLSKRAANSLRAGFAEMIEEARLREAVKQLAGDYLILSRWLTKRRSIEDRVDAERRWLTRDMLQSLQSERPQLDTTRIVKLLRDPALKARLGVKAVEVDRDLREWASDVGEAWHDLNARHSERELIECADIFDRVESRPLTPEQARAVVCFDNRVQLVASAGSGKTSTMVARAAYAMHRGIAKPDEIIMLAFNKQAAEELKERAHRSFQRLGMNGASVEASTFHKLGLGIIGRATGRKPDIPDWAFEPVEGFRKLAELIEGLKDRSMAFRAQWDLFRFVCTRDLPKFGETAQPDAWDEQGKGSE